MRREVQSFVVKHCSGVHIKTQNKQRQREIQINTSKQATFRLFGPWPTNGSKPNFRSPAEVGPEERRFPFLTFMALFPHNALGKTRGKDTNV